MVGGAPQGPRDSGEQSEEQEDDEEEAAEGEENKSVASEQIIQPVGQVITNPSSSTSGNKIAAAKSLAKSAAFLDKMLDGGSPIGGGGEAIPPTDLFFKTLAADLAEHQKSTDQKFLRKCLNAGVKPFDQDISHFKNKEELQTLLSGVLDITSAAIYEEIN